MQFPVNIPRRRRKSAVILFILYACFVCLFILLLVGFDFDFWLGLVCLVCLGLDSIYVSVYVSVVFAIASLN